MKTNCISNALAALVFAAASTPVYSAWNDGGENTAWPDSLTVSASGRSRYNDAAMAVAHKQMSIAYLGSDQLKRYFDSQSPTWKQAVDPNGTRQIIIVDSGSQNEDLIMRLLAKGNVIVSVGNARADASAEVFAKLQEIANGGPLTKSDGKGGGNGFYSKISTFEESPNSERIVDKGGISVSAYYYSPTGSRVFHTNELDTLTAVAEALQWASADDLYQSQPSEKAAYWSLQLTRESTCKAMNGTAVAGTLNVMSKFYKRIGDGSTTYDYWYVRYVAQMVPGTFRNADVETWSDASAGGGYVFNVEDYDPTTSSGDVSLATSGMTAGWSYSIGDIVVSDRSDFSRDQVQWYHDINQLALVGGNTVKVEPGVLLKVPQGASVSTTFDEHHKARFIRTLTWTTKSCTLDFN